MFQELELQGAVMWVLASARVSELLSTEPSLQPKFEHFKVSSILSQAFPRRHGANVHTVKLGVRPVVSHPVSTGKMVLSALCWSARRRTLGHCWFCDMF